MKSWGIYRSGKKFLIQIPFRGKKIYLGYSETWISACILRNKIFFNTYGLGGLLTAWEYLRTRKGSSFKLKEELPSLSGSEIKLIRESKKNKSSQGSLKKVLFHET